MLFECAEAIIDEDEICSEVLSSKEFWLREAIKDYETGNKRVKRSKQASATSNIAISCTKQACTRSKKKKPDCVWHMTESLLKDLVDVAIGEKIKERVENDIEKKAREMSDREFLLSVNNLWGDEAFLRCNLFSDVQERIKKKAFTDLFDDKFQTIYDQAYDTTMENILMSDLFWNDRKVDEFYHLREMDRQFSIV